LNTNNSLPPLIRAFFRLINKAGKLCCKLIAKCRAKKWLKSNCLILDTETTGLGKEAEIIEICIIDCTGKVLLNTLVKPRNPIPAEATAIHGITNEMVAAAPTWRDIHWQFMALTHTKTLVIYNIDFDVRLILQTAAINNCGFSSYELNAECAMHNYAEYYGQWDEKRNKFKWQKLVNAAEQQGVVIEGTAHRAYSDCKTTLGVIRAMAGTKS
jgi:DNA polymerase-3 subunit epsilon